MKYGLIGEKLGHSFSKIIHGYLSCEPYELHEVAKEDIDAFLTKRDFLGINVTIPYKERVIPALDCIDPEAEKIGAVNTVLNKGGRLFGYNTDAFGLTALIRSLGVDISGAEVAILGTGGTSKTARAVAEKLGAKNIITVSRTPKDGAVSYEELRERGEKIGVIINTTPVGMYPKNEASPVDLSHFPNLLGVIDAVYNPIRTRLIREAEKRNIPARGGLYMLVAQGIRASELFRGVEYPENTVDEVYKKLLLSTENIVLIGMPSSGKSSVGRALAEELGREFTDTDELIKARAGMEISEIFKSRGEGYFRELEADVIREVSKLSGKIIATGGGAPMFSSNVDALRQNGRLFFLDRPYELLIPTSDRPLSSSNGALYKLFCERHPKYTEISDEIIDGSGDVSLVCQRVLERLK